ncbi:AbrB/MazE/SpoVT family DNA-binding domain-containing protein [Kibdelosporangium philippinense]|uniref:AbrB/MazE/SpoVT family DNA-binding domain-containing protein n=1 Tax=Kibdelosporangium philippinense TaxID=211113 RepID=A0ABS8ZED0_9PSEU|nr:AbrB/MazE/SpoVT family DNA-binding domain-containing protein [Kibdelosporangium philippinense]MCE7005912.1 AbrB/MazE/SpoVT family DNA-binding domain-containing protein [Kibdelosporangium philippinense]
MSGKLTSKGQVTIPIAVREELGLQPGDEVDFIVEDGAAKIVRAASHGQRGQRIVARLRGRGDVPMTTEEIMALTRAD